MAKVTITENTLTAIANAIRSKLEVQTTYKPSEMASAISSIDGGESATLITKSVTQNGTYVASDDNADGYSSVSVNVSGSGGDVPANFIFGENGPSSSDGYDGDIYIQTPHTSIFYYNTGTSTSTTQIYGIEFEPLNNVTVYGFITRVGSGQTIKMRIGDLSDVLAETSSVTSTGSYQKIMLETPITLTAGQRYIVQTVNEGSGNGRIFYTTKSNDVAVNTAAYTVIQARYGGFPGNTQNAYPVVDLVTDAHVGTVSGVFFKESGTWKALL